MWRMKMITQSVFWWSRIQYFKNYGQLIDLQKTQIHIFFLIRLYVVYLKKIIHNATYMWNYKYKNSIVVQGIDFCQPYLFFDLTTNCCLRKVPMPTLLNLHWKMHILLNATFIRIDNANAICFLIKMTFY